MKKNYQWSIVCQISNLYKADQDISKQFNHTNNLKLIAKAHKLVMDGFNWAHVIDLLME